MIRYVDGVYYREGHGWVTPRHDGTRLECGGPEYCVSCRRELAEYELSSEVKMMDVDGTEGYKDMLLEDDVLRSRDAKWARDDLLTAISQLIEDKKRTGKYVDAMAHIRRAIMREIPD